jgi:transcriptional regulator with XRE-family HTH domain
MKGDFGPSPVGKRLALLRTALGYTTATAMAGKYGVEQRRYANWENGTTLLPAEYAVQLCQWTGATLDYIYFGDESGLPLRLVAALVEAAQVLGSQASRGKRGRKPKSE